MKVALVCTGLGHVRRGFETFTQSLFDVLKDDLDLTLFKGGGLVNGKKEVRVFNLSRDGLLSKLGVEAKRRYVWEQRTFALFFLPYLFRGKFDIIHYSDYDFGYCLSWLKRRLVGGASCAAPMRGWKPRLHFPVLLFSNGAPAPPSLFAHADFVQVLTPVHFQEAIDYGIEEERLFLVPYGIDCRRFRPVSAQEKERLRRLWGLPLDKKVVLCVGAINAERKRIDYLIREFARLDHSKYFLLVVGQREKESEKVEQLAMQLLGQNFKFMTAPHERMPEIYAASDLLVLPSLVEGFGLVVAEAMASGLPLLVHDMPLFRWLVGTKECLVDMTVEGNLAHHIERMMSSRELRASIAQKNLEQVQVRFDWRVLKNDYLAMYQKALRGGRICVGRTPTLL